MKNLNLNMKRKSSNKRNFNKKIGLYTVWEILYI